MKTEDKKVFSLNDIVKMWDENYGEKFAKEYSGIYQLMKKQAENNKSKEHYFLLGQDICREYHEKEFEEVLESAKTTEFKVHKFVEGEHPDHIIEATQGWLDYATITEEEYEQLLKIQEDGE